MRWKNFGWDLYFMTETIDWPHVLMTMLATFVGAWAGAAVGARLQKRWDLERSRLAEVNLARAVQAELVEQQNFLLGFGAQMIDHLRRILRTPPVYSETVTLSERRAELDPKTLSFLVDHGLSSTMLEISVHQDRYGTLLKLIEERNHYLNELIFRYPDGNVPERLSTRLQQLNEQLVEFFDFVNERGFELVQRLDDEFSRLFPGTRFQRLDESARPKPRGVPTADSG